MAALVIESTGVTEAIRRSVVLVRGHMGRAFLIGLCGSAVTYASFGLFQGPFIVAAFVVGLETATGLFLYMAGAALGTIGATFTAPIMIVGYVVLYFDVRVRHEALDLQVMLGALDAGASPDGTPPPPVADF